MVARASFFSGMMILLKELRVTQHVALSNNQPPKKHERQCIPTYFSPQFLVFIM